MSVPGAAAGGNEAAARPRPTFLTAEEVKDLLAELRLRVHWAPHPQSSRDGRHLLVGDRPAREGVSA